MANDHIADDRKKVRLIDANALRERMFSYYSCVDENSSKEYYKGETLMSYEVADMIEDCIDNAPTVDAVPVVHGHWISLYKCSNAGVYCSVCHKKVWKEDYAWCNRKNKLRSNYCPNCGADMRERSAGE